MKLNLNIKNTFAFTVLITVFLFSTCKKQTSTQSDPTRQSTGHGRGAILNRAAFLNTPKVDMGKLHVYLKSMGFSPNYQLYSTGKEQTQTVNPLPSHPVSVILSHPPIGNQGGTETCLSWAVGYCAKEVLDLTWKNPTADAGLRSGWFLYNMICSNPQYATYNPGCSGANGLVTIDAFNYAQQYGVASQTTEPSYAACTPAPSSAAITSAASDKSASSYGAVTNFGTIQELIAAGLPVVLAFDFYNDFETAFNTGTTWSTLNSPAGGLGHAVCLIGYDDTKGAFLAQNSWGLTGGDPANPGCIWINYGVVQSLLGEGLSHGGGEAYALEPINSTTPVNAYYNTLQYTIFSPNTCTGTNIPNPPQVVYEVPANRYSSPVSVAAANAVASYDVQTNGQTFANNHLNACVVPPLPTQMFNFQVVGDFGSTSNYNIQVNGTNISGTKTMGNYSGAMVNYVNPPVTATATVVVQITSGYPPKSAIFEGTGPATGVVNGNIITFTNVAMWSGQTCELIFQ